MTKDNTVNLLKVIVASYPTFKPEDIKFTVETWFAMLEQYDYQVVALALKNYIATNTTAFAPSIGQLINEIVKITSKDQLSESQAWDLVSKALKDSYYHAQERFDELPPIVQEVVGSASMLHSWGQSDMKSIETVIASNFKKSYRVILERENERAKMPQQVQMFIENNKQLMLGTNE